MKSLLYAITLLMMTAVAFGETNQPISQTSNQLSYRWKVETSRPANVTVEVYQGETLTLEATLTTYSRAFIPPQDAEARFFWRDSEARGAYWSEPATLTGNKLTFTWTPNFDVGAKRYDFFLSVDSDTEGTAYRAFGTLVMRESPGFNPAELEAPDVLADIVDRTADQVLAQTDAKYAALGHNHDGVYLKSYTESDPLWSSAKPGIEATLQSANQQISQSAADIVSLQEDLSAVADRSATNTADIASLETQLATKQDTLTAGDGIAITDNIISAIGGTLETFGLSGGTDNASVYAWYGNLGMLGVPALQINAITELSIYKRGGSSPNADTPLYARILRKDGTAWRVAYQSTNTQTFNMFSAMNARIPFTMRNVDGTPAIPANEDVAVVFVSVSDAPADTVLAVGARTTGSYRGSVTSDTGGSLPLIPGTQDYGMAMQMIAYVDAPTAWEDVTGKPDTFTPSEHSHSYNDLTNKPTITSLGGLTKSQMVSYFNEQGVETDLAPLTRSNALHDASKAEDAILVRKDDDDPYSGFGTRSISVKNAETNGVWSFKGRTVENVSNAGLASYTATTYPNSGGSQALLGAYASTGAQNVAAVEAKATASEASLTLSDTTGTLTLTPTTQWPWNKISDKPTTWAWSAITGKPETFTPATHTHSQYLTSFTETDPTISAWAKATTKPTYTASEVGAATSGHNHDAAYLKLSGGTVTGQIRLTGLATDHRLRTRGISGGSRDGAENDNLYLNYDSVELTTEEYLDATNNRKVFICGSTGDTVALRKIDGDTLYQPKGTYLTSYTETDPVYLADKPTLEATLQSANQQISQSAADINDLIERVNALEAQLSGLAEALNEL